MTESTNQRQIILLVKGIMQKHNLTDLQVEIDFSSAFWRYVTERKAGRTAVQIREDILKDLEIGAAKATAQENMESRIKFATGLSVNELWYRDGVIDFLIARDAEGQTVEHFAKACTDDPYNMPKFFKFSERPSLIKDNWGLAFMKKTDEVRPAYNTKPDLNKIFAEYAEDLANEEK